MQKLSILFFLTVSLNFLFLQNGYCQEGGSSWIIIDGPGVGIQLAGNYNSGTTISSPNNIGSNADGTINEPSDSCPGDKRYYSGTLYNQSATGGCGWGHVIRYDQASPELKNITDTISTEEVVHSLLQRSDPQSVNVLSVDKGFILSVLQYIDDLKSLLTKNNKYSSRTTRNIFRKLDSVAKLDNEVVKGYTKLISHAQSTGKDLQPTDLLPLRKKLGHDLSIAYDLKVKIVQEIVQADGLLK